LSELSYFQPICFVILFVCKIVATQPETILPTRDCCNYEREYNMKKIQQQQQGPYLSNSSIQQCNYHFIQEYDIDEYAAKKQYCDNEAAQLQQSCERQEQVTSITLTKVTDLAYESIMSIILYLPKLEGERERPDIISYSPLGRGSEKSIQIFIHRGSGQ